jgi:DNA-binding transcriptional MerR regulator
MMRIGELAQASAVSRDPADRVQLVQYIKTAQRLGFNLGEIGHSVGAIWQSPDPDSAVTRLLQDKLKLIEARMSELGALRDELQQRLGQDCPLNPRP